MKQMIYITLGRAKEIAESVKKNCEGLDVALRDKWINDRVGKPVFDYYPSLGLFLRKKARKTKLIESKEHLIKLEDKYSKGSWIAPKHDLRYWSRYTFEYQLGGLYRYTLEIDEPDDTMVAVDCNYFFIATDAQNHRKEVGLEVHYP